MWTQWIGLFVVNFTTALLLGGCALNVGSVSGTVNAKADIKTDVTTGQTGSAGTGGDTVNINVGGTGNSVTVNTGTVIIAPNSLLVIGADGLLTGALGASRSLTFKAIATDIAAKRPVFAGTATDGEEGVWTIEYATASVQTQAVAGKEGKFKKLPIAIDTKNVDSKVLSRQVNGTDVPGILHALDMSAVSSVGWTISLLQFDLTVATFRAPSMLDPTLTKDAMMGFVAMGDDIVVATQGPDASVGDPILFQDIATLELSVSPRRDWDKSTESADFEDKVDGVATDGKTFFFHLRNGTVRTKAGGAIRSRRT